MDFITAGGILICIGILWIFGALMLRLIYRLQERIEYLELVQNEQHCQHCRWKETCPAYDSGVIYPCKHFEEESNDNGTDDITGAYGNNTRHN